MKTIRLIAVSVVFAAIFSLSALSQGAAQPAAGTGKVGVIDSGAFFDEKAGITKISAAYKVMETEFAPKTKELETLATRLQTLEKEIKNMQEQAGKGVPVDQVAYQSKADEYERLGREGKFKQEELGKAIENRRSQLIGPIYQDIGKTLGEYAKSKGFAMVIDAAKDQAQMLIYISDTVDITADFIKLYNARPATTASTATPAKPAPAKQP